MDPIKPNDAERIEASALKKESKIAAFNKISRFFELDVTIKMFGQVVFHWHYPPEK